MPAAILASVDLDPVQNVLRDGERLVVQGGPAWLALRFPGDVPAGRWISLAYRSSYLDVLIRPVLRCITADGPIERMLPAPLFGRAEWVGRIPDGTTSMQISPTDRPGPFGFEIEYCRTLSRFAVWARAWRHDRRRALLALGSRCIGQRREVHRLLQVALGATPLTDYHAWRKTRYRKPAPDGLDAIRAEDASLPHIRIAIAAPARHRDHVCRLLNAFAAQPYPYWSLAWICPDHPLPDPAVDDAVVSGRLLMVAPDRPVADLLRAPPRSLVIGTMRDNDSLPSHALTVLAAHAAARTEASFFYGDEDAIDARDRYMDPRLKPDWSPAFDAAQNYTGAALFVRGAWLARHDAMPVAAIARDDALGTLLADAAPAEVAHVRRVLLTRRAAPARRGRDASPATVPPAPVPPRTAERPAASIVIPSKDRAHLLSACVESLRRTAAPGEIEIIVADNGSTEDATRALYDTLKSDERIRVVDCPGPFNFSRQCNTGAEVARAPVLIFLNNDVEAVDGTWLQPLLAWAGRPDVGAVGSTLLFPSGRLQHAGVVLGLNGLAGHIDYGDAPGNPGYLQRRRSAHEVSAVTAACLAVDRTRFEAVGGFDAENLPVELSDIDMCLRLSERGWRTILAPDSVLVHHESASRGDSTAQMDRYRNERDFFTARWRNRLRDDPCFHPALSLTSLRAALG